VPAPKRPREEVVELIGEVFRRHGYDGASLRLISETTGLGRASLYHYFPGGKEQMGREVFDHIDACVRADLLDPLRTPGSPDDRLAAWLRGVERFYDGGRKNCLLGAMVLSGGGDRYRQEIGATFRALIDALAQALRDAGFAAATARRRATGAVATIQGALVTARGIGDTEVFRHTVRDLPAQLMRPERAGS
jgi:AcrR family transcriptional regulator